MGCRTAGHSAVGASTSAESRVTLSFVLACFPHEPSASGFVDAAAMPEYLPDGDSGGVRNLREEFVERVGEL